jgi:hypothetical protein
MYTALSVVVLLLVRIAPGELIPDAPHLQMRPPASYMQTESGVLHDYPSSFKRRPRLVDWQFIVAHGVYGASVAFDNYVTARNVGTCAFEGNPDLGRLPSSKAIAIHAATEVALVVVADVGLKWLGRRNEVPRWVNELGGNMSALIGTAKHVRGGTQWVKLCY